jgi:hydrogenase expression/formation protein HypC
MCLAIPGKIQSITNDDELTRAGLVDFAGIVKEINLAFVPEAKIGDYVLVHVGFAINTIDEEEAKKVFEYLRQIEETGDLEEGAQA